MPDCLHSIQWSLNSSLYPNQAMSTLTNGSTLFHVHIRTTTKPQNHHSVHSIPPPIRASISTQENATNRRKILTALVATSLVLGQLQCGTTSASVAPAQNWGTRSFMWERYFKPDLSPEDSAARIRQTAEGLHSMRDMLERMAWRYVLFYIRVKQAYLSKDLKIAFYTLPESRQDDYIKSANELIDNMAMFDRHIRTPRVYESYLYYEKTLKSIDEIVALLG